MQKRISDHETDTIKLIRFSEKEKARLYQDPSGFVHDNLEKLNQARFNRPFYIGRKRQIKLLFGFEVGVTTSRLRYALDDDGNVSRSRYDQWENKQELGYVAKTGTNFGTVKIDGAIGYEPMIGSCFGLGTGETILRSIRYCQTKTYVSMT